MTKKNNFFHGSIYIWGGRNYKNCTNLKVKEKYKKDGDSVETEAAFKAWGCGASFRAAFSESEEERSKVTTQAILDQLSEKEDMYNWDGEKFVMKPMELRDPV